MSKRRNYGNADTFVPATSQEQEQSSLPNDEIIKGLSTFLFGQEAREAEQVIVARIQNHQALAQTQPFLRTFHLNEVNKLQAKLKAVKEQAGEARYAAQTSAVTRTGVALISLFGTGAVVLGTIYIGARAWKAVKEA